MFWCFSVSGYKRSFWCVLNEWYVEWSTSYSHLHFYSSLLYILLIIFISSNFHCSSPNLLPSHLLLIFLFSTIIHFFWSVYALLFEYPGEEHTYFIDWFWAGIWERQGTGFIGDYYYALIWLFCVSWSYLYLAWSWWFIYFLFLKC